jgi:hypothetical protein
MTIHIFEKEKTKTAAWAASPLLSRLGPATRGPSARGRARQRSQPSRARSPLAHARSPALALADRAAPPVIPLLPLSPRPGHDGTVVGRRP